MTPIAVGTRAPEVPGAAPGTKVLLFYKITCPVCQMAAPKYEELSRLSGRLAAIGQDPPDALEAFGHDHGFDPPTVVTDAPPYDISNAFGVRVVPTAFLIDDAGLVADVVESWDRESFNRMSRSLADLTGSDRVALSGEGDGLPSFRPG